jgi:hypothetical protein
VPVRASENIEVFPPVSRLVWCGHGPWPNLFCQLISLYKTGHRCSSAASSVAVNCVLEEPLCILQSRHVRVQLC